MNLKEPEFRTLIIWDKCFAWMWKSNKKLCFSNVVSSLQVKKVVSHKTFWSLEKMKSVCFEKVLFSSGNQIRPEINFSRQIFITGNPNNMCILWTIYHRKLKPKNECWNFNDGKEAWNLLDLSFHSTFYFSIPFLSTLTNNPVVKAAKVQSCHLFRHQAQDLLKF